MPCPTCDHTMQGLGCLEGVENLYWCPRCGTLRRSYVDVHEQQPYQNDSYPTLPGRVANLLMNEVCSRKVLDVAARLGVIESCMAPAALERLIPRR